MSLLSLTTTHSCATDAPLVALASWLRARGAFLSPKLEIHCDEPADGATSAAALHHRPRRVRVATGHALEAGELVASVPLSLLVTQGAAAAASPRHDANVASGTNRIALFLLRQRLGEEGEGDWQPYARALPPNVSTTLAWSAAELAELQASDLAAHSASRRVAVARNHEHVASQVAAAEEAAAVPSPFSFSEAEFGWALSMVWSRGHQVAMPGAPGGRAEGALAPLLDLFDHAADPNVAAANVEGGDALVLRARRAAAAGEAAAVPYGAGGPLSNARLLMDYGFCLDANPNDDVALPLSCAAAGAEGATAEGLEEARERVLRLAGLGDGGAPPPRLTLGPSGLPVEVLVTARVCSMGATHIHTAEATLQRGGREAVGSLAAWLGASAQQLVSDAPTITFLRGALRRRAAEYTTTLREDEALLAAEGTEGGEGGERRKCALAVRLAEKRILSSWHAWATQQLGDGGVGGGGARGGAASKQEL